MVNIFRVYPVPQKKVHHMCLFYTIVMTLLTGNLSVMTLLAGNLPVMTLLTDNLQVMKLLTGNLQVMTLLYGSYDPPN